MHSRLRHGLSGFRPGPKCTVAGQAPLHSGSGLVLSKRAQAVTCAQLPEAFEEGHPHVLRAWQLKDCSFTDVQADISVSTGTQQRVALTMPAGAAATRTQQAVASPSMLGAAVSPTSAAACTAAHGLHHGAGLQAYRPSLGHARWMMAAPYPVAQWYGVLPGRSMPGLVRSGSSRLRCWAVGPGDSAAGAGPSPEDRMEALQQLIKAATAEHQVQDEKLLLLDKQELDVLVRTKRTTKLLLVRASYSQLVSAGVSERAAEVLKMLFPDPTQGC